MRIPTANSQLQTFSVAARFSIEAVVRSPAPRCDSVCVALGAQGSMGSTLMVKTARLAYVVHAIWLGSRADQPRNALANAVVHSR